MNQPLANQFWRINGRVMTIIDIAITIMIVASGTIIYILVKRCLIGEIPEYRPVQSFKTRGSMVQWLQDALLRVKTLAPFPPGGRKAGKKSGTIDCRKMGESRLANNRIYRLQVPDETQRRGVNIPVRW